MLVLRGHRDSVYRVVYSPDGRWLASAGGDRTVRLWDLADRQLRHTLWGHPATVWSLAFSADGQVLASGGFDGRLVFWETASGNFLGEAATDNLQVRTLIRGPDGNFTAGRWQHRLYERERAAFWRFSPRGQSLGKVVPEDVRSVTASLSPPAVWTRPEPWGHLAPVSAGSPYPPERILCLAFSADGMTVAFAEERGYACLYLYTFAEEGLTAHGVASRQDLVRALAFLPASAVPTLAAAENAEVVLWDVSTLRVLRKLTGHTDWVYDLAVTPDGSWLVSAGREGVVRLWDPATGRQEHAWGWGVGPVWSVDVAPDGHTAAAGGEDGSVVVWDLDF